ncbi:phage baseplate assembly protein V [Pseudomonas fluorescens]|uniref:phage baseplate assembly protein V n=1 Tax=Pseudomonas fluorescens TaxID=294 RepID=UPI00259BB6D8|nr:phage baseplate assembly protein V [Pseudomonas fluorescens]WJK10271.1 phage baseplate assembly protein V [Pseudomonas fluorescens]
MTEFADLSRRLESLIRTGTISEVRYKPLRVRVATGGLTSNWLACITLRAGNTRDWDPPTANEQCVIFSPSGDPALGLVLVGLNSDSIPAPSESPDECLRVYPDGAQILYNHKTGALTVSGIKTALLQAAEKCVIDCPKVETTGDLLVKGKLTVVQGADFTGDVIQQGGNMISNGIVVHTHKHPGTGGPI